MRRNNITLQELNDMYPVFMKQITKEFGEANTEKEKELHNQILRDKLKQYINKEYKKRK